MSLADTLNRLAHQPHVTATAVVRDTSVPAEVLRYDDTGTIAIHVGDVSIQVPGDIEGADTWIRDLVEQLLEATS